MQLSPKTSSSTAITMSQIVLPYHANVAGNMHGGEVMKLMDSAAGAVAARHCLSNVVTASVTQLSFIEPIFVGDLVICNAQLIYTGKTSMEVCVKSFVEELNSEKKLINIAYVVMVALDEFERPVEVPGLVIETEEERCDWEMGRKRYLARKERKNDPSCT